MNNNTEDVSCCRAWQNPVLEDWDVSSTDWPEFVFNDRCCAAEALIVYIKSSQSSWFTIILDFVSISIKKKAQPVEDCNDY